MTKSGIPQLPSPTRPPRPHLAFVDGIRALAALFVTVHHAYIHLPGFQESRLGVWLAPLRHGHYAVDVFIVVSGFCLMLPVVLGDGALRGGFTGFLKRRIWRILPPYYLALGFTLLLIYLAGLGQQPGTHWGASLPFFRRDILLHLGLLQDFQRPYKINHCFWSIAVEFHIYLVFPLLLIAWNRLKAAGPWIVTGFLTAFMAVLGIVGISPEQAHSPLPEAYHYIALFAFGLLAAHLAYGPTTDALRAKALRLAPWLALVIAVPLSIVALRGPVQPFVISDLFAGLATAALLLHLSLTPDSRLRRFCEIRGLVLIGLFSYSLYLVHAPLIELAWRYLIKPIGLTTAASTLLLIALTPLYVAIGYGFYWLCERPFIGRIPSVGQVLTYFRLTSRKPPEAADPPAKSAPPPATPPAATVP